VVLWTELRVLVADTSRLWWRLLPRLLSLWLLGWLGRRLFASLAIVAGDISPWLTLIIFPLGILSELIAVVLILQACGRELGIRGLIPASELVEDDRDAGVTQLLAITLLPFLGLYAAFGHINDAAYELYVQQMARYGVLSDTPTVLGLLNDLAQQHTLRLLLIVIGLYVARRLIDLAHERTGWGPLGVLVALVETFFILLLVMGGIRLWQLAKVWLRDRAFMRWIDTLSQPLEHLLATIQLSLPDLVVAGYDLVFGRVWPVLADTLLQPLVWLAVAAIIFGSNVMSLAELNRTVRDRLPARGTSRPPRVRMPVPGSGSPHQEKAPAAGLRRVGSEARAAFLGDIDDKYLPTLRALRLVIRSGPIFLGSFVLVYATVTILGNYLHTLVRLLVGGHPLQFWLIFDPLFDLVQTLPIEPLRLCLLAVAFRRCLELFDQRSRPRPPDPRPTRTPAPAADQSAAAVVGGR
jgi:hypothetical protein